MAERSGAKTQLTGVTGAVLITVMIVFIPGLFRNLPQPALAAVVITASLSLADIPGTVRLWRQRKAEFLLSIAAFRGVVLLGVLPGIAIAVGLSILNVFRRAWWPYETELGRVDGLEGYHDVHSYPEAEHLPGLVIYRFDGPLFFANAKTFRDEVRRLARAEPPPVWIVIAAEPMTDVDTTASDVLEELDESAERRRHQPGIRRAQGPGPGQDRALRAHPHHRPAPLLPHHRSRHRRLPPADRRPVGPCRSGRRYRAVRPPRITTGWASRRIGTSGDCGRLFRRSCAARSGEGLVRWRGPGGQDGASPGSGFPQDPRGPRVRLRSLEDPVAKRRASTRWMSRRTGSGRPGRSPAGAPECADLEVPFARS